MGKWSQPSCDSEEPKTYSENMCELEKTAVATQEMLHRVLVSSSSD